jgi:hypothetical protein
MRLVDLPTFLAMPAGTVYAKYEPCVFGELAIKDDSVPASDPVTWYLQDLIPWFEGCNESMGYFDALESMQRGEETPPLDYDITSKDGLYEREQLFAVFERRDVEALVARLSRALNDGYSQEQR